MHIADGVLSPAVCAATGAISLTAVGYGLHRLRDSLADRLVPLTGMTAALVFAGQMVNFPLGVVPVSGHLIGGVLAAVLVGPWAGCLAITLVLVAQRFLFADGGLLPLGANVLHMGVIGSIGGYAVYAQVRKWCGNGAGGTIAGAVIASWLTVMAAAALFCVEFRLSHPRDEVAFGPLFTLMISVHSLIGIGEALITGAVVAFVLANRPDLIAAPGSEPGRVANAGRLVAVGLVAALAVGGFLSPFASSLDDGLDHVAGRFGFADAAPAAPALFDDYDGIPLPAAAWEQWSTSIAGVGGSLVVFAMALLMGRLVPRRNPPAEPVGGGAS